MEQAGSGTVFFRVQEKHRSRKGNIFIRRVLGELPEGEQATIIATGPLTNLAFLLRIFPEVKEKIQEIVFMGGSLSGGNVTDAAEFNFLQTPRLRIWFA